jgi:hypothetical protein
VVHFQFIHAIYLLAVFSFTGYSVLPTFRIKRFNFSSYFFLFVIIGLKIFNTYSLELNKLYTM